MSTLIGSPGPREIDTGPNQWPVRKASLLMDSRCASALARYRRLLGRARQDTANQTRSDKHGSRDGVEKSAIHKVPPTIQTAYRAKQVSVMDTLLYRVLYVKVSLFVQGDSRQVHPLASW